MVAQGIRTLSSETSILMQTQCLSMAWEEGALDLCLGPQTLLPPNAFYLPSMGNSHDCRCPGLCELLTGIYYETTVTVSIHRPRRTLNSILPMTQSRHRFYNMVGKIVSRLVNICENNHLL